MIRGSELPPRGPDSGQPYILIPEQLESTFEVAIIVDKLPFIKLEVKDEDKGCEHAIIALLGTYFILSLEYPSRARKAYNIIDRFEKYFLV